jgi:geranylgeranyl pyrophosphate synthase
MLSLLSLPEIKLGLEETRALMERSVRDASPHIKEGLAALLKREGEMIRAALVILASGFGQADAGRMLGIAASVELLDLAIFLHYDAMSTAAPRRGVKASSSVFDSRLAILMGDFLLTRSLRLFIDAVPKSDPGLFTRTIERICEGEIEQGFQLYDTAVTTRLCLRRAHEKTAILFGLAMRLAAVEASCPKPHAQALTRFGYCLGMGYRITEDILDFSSGGCDAAAGVFTLPMVFAMKEKGSKLPSLLKKPPYSPWKLKRIVKAVRSSAGMVRAREVADDYGRLALRQLEKLPDINARAALRELVGVVLNRKA